MRPRRSHHDGAGRRPLLAKPATSRGTVHVIFQPAEGAAVAAASCEEGACSSASIATASSPFTTGLICSWGKWGTRVGPFMAAADSFTIEITGRGGRAARPHLLCDPMVVAANPILAAADHRLAQRESAGDGGDGH